jgi:hypothetical protein
VWRVYPAGLDGGRVFVFILPEQMACQLDEQARFLLTQAGIREPVTWEPPFDWVTAIPWPGPGPRPRHRRPPRHHRRPRPADRSPPPGTSAPARQSRTALARAGTTRH